MAEHVTGDTYREIDGQLLEIIRQLRQRNGYPFSLDALKQGLQFIIEGRFIETAGRALYSLFEIFTQKRGFPCFTIEHRSVSVVKYGKPLMRDIFVPVELSDGSYRLLQFRNDVCGGGTECSLPNLPHDIHDIMKGAQEMPVIEWVGSESVGKVWRVSVVGKTHNKYFEFYLTDYNLIVLRSGQIPISHGGGCVTFG